MALSKKARVEDYRAARPPPASMEDYRAAWPPPARMVGDDILGDVFLRLPSVASLARAALACKRWGRIISDPSFVRRFRSLHPPPLLGLFINPRRPDPPAFSPSCCLDPDLASAVACAGFSLDCFRPYEGWKLADIRGSHLLLIKQDEQTPKHQDLLAVYDPSARCGVSVPPPPPYFLMGVGETEPRSCGYHLVATSASSFLVVTAVQDGSWMSAAVFDSVSSEWRLGPWDAVVRSRPRRYNFSATMLAGRRIYWDFMIDKHMLELDMETMRFSSLDLPPHGYEYKDNRYYVGEMEDGRVYFVGFRKPSSVVLWLRGEDGSGKHKWVLEKEALLEAEIGRVTVAENAQYLDYGLSMVAVQGGFAYLRMCIIVSVSFVPGERTYTSCEWLLSLDLQTMRLQVVHKDGWYGSVKLYMMAWPPTFLGKWCREMLA